MGSPAAPVAPVGSEMRLSLSAMGASLQGLTLVHFSAQHEHLHFLRSFVAETNQLVSRKVLTLSYKVD